MSWGLGAGDGWRFLMIFDVFWLDVEDVNLMMNVENGGYWSTL